MSTLDDKINEHFAGFVVSLVVPAGRIVEFERLVGSYAHARVYRPN